MSRDCDAYLIGIHPDWKWDGMDTSAFSRDLPGITWSGCRQLAAAQGAFPELDKSIAGFRAYTGHYGLHKYVTINFVGGVGGHSLLLMFEKTGNSTSEIHYGKQQQEMEINFVGNSSNFSPFVNGMYAARNASDLEASIDKWMSPSVIEANTTKAFVSGRPTLSLGYERGTLTRIGSPSQLHAIARVYAIVLLAFNNNLLGQMRKKITFA